MNAELLLQHFNRISEAPEAVERLRRFILDLAVRGKLVEQDPDDEPASELIMRIQAEKIRLEKEGTLKKGRPALSIQDGERPFALPAQWQFVRLGDILQMLNGRAFKPTDWLGHGLPIVRIQNLNNAHAPFNYCAPESIEDRHIIRDGEFLISWSGTPGTSFGAFIWNRGTAALNQHIFRCIQIGEAFYPDFLRLAINSQLDVLISKAQGGVGLQHVTKGTLEDLPLPLPPLPEQHRIVAKVDELMALCDQLKASQKKRESQRDCLVAASLHRIVAVVNHEPVEALTDVTRFHITHLPRLTTRPEHIKQLRQTILNLAVCGRLAPQDPNDEPVSILLERIKSEQRNSIELGLLKKRAVKNNQEEGSRTYSIPANWSWVKLADLIIYGPQNGISPKEIKDDNAPKAITLTATTSGFFNAAYYKHVELSEKESESYWLSSGDVLFQRGNTREYVGMAAIFDGPAKSFVFPDLMIRVRFSKSLALRFAHMVFISPPLRSYFSCEATGASTTMPKINQPVLLNAPFPLPPLAEQHRIVAKVDKLMAICDQLEAQLNATQTDSRRLLEAVLRDSLDNSAMATA